MPEDLQRVLDTEVEGIRASTLTPTVARLIDRYRSDEVADRPILATDTDALAYMAYRMPATVAAVGSGLRRLAACRPDFRPRTLLDVGGGTGAAVWAAAQLWPSLESAVVLERSEPVIALGRRLAAEADSPVVRAARWNFGALDTTSKLPAADLVTVSYVLGELPDDVRAGLPTMLAETAPVVALVEPGTPAGYRRIATARRRLVDAGRTVVAPCPHDRPCPLFPTDDWCHFSARVPRTALHRRLKGATLGHEDEKFSYVVAARDHPSHVDNRVLRHPLRRKGLVQLRLCTAEGGTVDRIVSRRQGGDYRAARATDWGDAWPPSGQDGVG